MENSDKKFTELQIVGLKKKAEADKKKKTEDLKKKFKKQVALLESQKEADKSNKNKK